MQITDTQMKISAIVAGSTTVGFVGGYFLAKKTLAKKYAEIADQEIKDAREHYNRRAALQKPYSSPEEAVQELMTTDEPAEDDSTDEEVEAYEETVEGLGYSEETPASSPTVINVFNAPPPSPEELEDRDPNVPYLISVSEFMENDNSYEQTTLAYFEEDDVLCDESEQIIPDVEGTVTSANLKRFGEGGSMDAHTVYVRNDKLKTDFEIVLEESSYVRMVLGNERDG